MNVGLLVEVILSPFQARERQTRPSSSASWQARQRVALGKSISRFSEIGLLHSEQTP